jgi:hypothetical protein
MDPLQFVAALAWPAVVLILAFAYREAIGRMLDRPPTRVKVGPLEVEWAETERAVAVALATGAAETARSTLSGSLLDRLAALAETDPSGAIIAAWSEVERALRDRLGSIGQQPSVSGTTLTHLARESGLISAQTEEAINGLRVLRNLSAHGQAGEVDHEKALDYITLADATVYAIQTWRPKDGASPASR